MRTRASTGLVPVMLAAVLAAGMGATSVAAQGVASPDSDTDQGGRSRGRTALHGALLGGALAATPVVLISREPEEDVGIAILLGLASGGATGAMLPLAAGARRTPWKAGLVGLGTGSLVGGLTLGLAWNDPSVEFTTTHKMAIGAVAGGVLGLIVGAVVGGGSDGEEDRSRRAAGVPPPPGVRLFLSPSLSSPGRWTGSVSVSLP